MRAQFISIFSIIFNQKYVYGNYIDEVLYKKALFGPVGARYLLHDHLYSVVAIVSTSGDVNERYEYDAYGNPTIWDAGFTTKKSSPGYFNTYLFTGRQVDILNSGSLKIQYNRNRCYDYFTGRWLTLDPLGITPNSPKPNGFNVLGQYTDGMNVYGYVKSKPVSTVDEYGLACSGATCSSGTGKAGAVCCKVKTWVTKYTCTPYGCIPVSEPSCTQQTIYSGCSPETACCALKNMNTTVYEAKAGECCWCNVLLDSSLVDIYGITVAAHRRVNVECAQGRGKWGADVGIGVRTDPHWWQGIQVPVAVYDTSGGGTYQGRISCDAADKWRAQLTGMMWWYNFPFHDCWTFARETINGMIKSCP